MAETAPRLVLDDVTLGYGKAIIVKDVSLVLHAGETVAITGPNGAGKTTLLRGIVGADGCTVKSGSIGFDATAIVRMRPERAAAMGISLVPQGRALFPYSTGQMNVWSGGFPRKDAKAVATDIDGFFERWPIARRVRRRLAVGMSGGEQQLLALGRGLMNRPSLLLVDEPSLGLAPVLVRELAGMLAQYTQTEGGEHGMATIVVEQNVELALDVADRVFVMTGGRLVKEWRRGEATAAEIGQFYMR